jgi:hypothetical protein
MASRSAVGETRSAAAVPVLGDDAGLRQLRTKAAGSDPRAAGEEGDVVALPVALSLRCLCWLLYCGSREGLDVDRDRLSLSLSFSSCRRWHDADRERFGRSLCEASWWRCPAERPVLFPREGEGERDDLPPLLLWWGWCRLLQMEDPPAAWAGDSPLVAVRGVRDRVRLVDFRIDASMSPPPSSSSLLMAACLFWTDVERERRLESPLAFGLHSPRFSLSVDRSRSRFR